MSESVRRRKYRYDRVLIESARILAPQFDDAVVYLTGAQIEMLRNVTQYLNRLDTYVTEYNPGYYIAPTAADYDDILEIVADLEEALMGNPNTLWGYYDQEIENYSDTKSGPGTYQKWGGDVPAGQVWILHNVSLMNTTGARGRTTLQMDTSEGLVVLDSVAAPGLDAVVWTGALAMKEGDNLEVLQLLCLDGDVMKGGMIATKMVVPT